MTRRERSTGPALSVRISDAFLEALGGADSQITDLARARPPELTPERKLRLAVLEDAIDALTSTTVGDRAEAERAAARRWFDCADADWPFGFLAICDVLGLNPQYLRNGLAAQRRARMGLVLRDGRRREGGR